MLTCPSHNPSPLTVDEAVTQFTLLNPPSGATAFSILITQDTTGYSVGIATFKDSGGSDIDVKFPAGGVLPIVTTTAKNRISIPLRHSMAVQHSSV